jgi:HEAT repeat protein/actin-like ATPase involved in cell morphogenesis
MLKDANPEVRQKAAEALIDMGTAAQVPIPHLISLLSDSDRNVRWYAAYALIGVGTAAQVAIPHLVPLLSDSDPGVRWITASALGDMGTAAEVAIPHLVPLLSDSNETVRQYAAQALGKMGTAAHFAIPRLIPLLSDSDETVRFYAAEALGTMGTAAQIAIPHLIPLLSDSDETVRFYAAQALGKMGTAAQIAIPHLIPLLSDSENNVRWITAMVLVGIATDAQVAIPQVAIPHLIPLLSDSDKYVRQYAAQALGTMGTAAQIAIPHLIPLLSDSENNVRNSAAYALGTMGTAAEVAIPYLTLLLTDSNEYARGSAANALENIRETATVTSQSIPLPQKAENANLKFQSNPGNEIKKATIFTSITKDKGIHLGIDFGTTFSSAAILINGEIKRVKEPSKLGYSFPSSIFVDKQGKVFVGQFAENQRFQDTSSYIREFKRELGKTMSSTWGIRKFLPEDLVSEMFKLLKQEAEKMVNQQIDGVIATIPASYTDYRSELMEKAARNAGFKQVQLLPEPVAAAIYYDHPSSGGKPLAKGEVLLVYDLGGGTFDAALLQKQGDGYQMLAQPVGDENLGGSNFDWAMYQDLQAQCSDTLRALLNPRAQEERAMKTRLRVKDWLREFKHQLSSLEQHTDDLPVGDFESYTLTRKRFEEMIHPQLQTTCGLCNQLVASAGLRWEQVGKILLVGGSCRIPYVQRLLYSQFKRPVEWVDELELAVCLGAAIYREVGQNKS